LEVIATAIYPLNFALDRLCARLQCDYFHENSERSISVVIQLLNSAI